MGRLIQYLKKYIGIFIIAIAFLSLETACDLFQPFLASRLIDRGIMQTDMALIRHYGLLMILVTIVGMVGALMRNWLSSIVSYRFAMELRQDLFEKLLSMPMLKVEKLERGSMITRLTSDVNNLQQFINGIMRIFLKAPLLAVGSFFMVMRLNHRFMTLYLMIIPLSIVLILINLKLGYPLYERIQRKFDALNQRTMEFLSGIRTVKAFNRFNHEGQLFSKISFELKHITTRTQRLMAIFGPMVQFTVNAAIALALYLGAGWVSNGDIEVGEIVAFTNYMTQFYFALSVITRIFNVFVRAKASAERITEVLDQDGYDITDDKRIPSDGEIIFEDVSYHYGEGEATLKNISLEIKSGERVGVIGSTGSGKSTLIHLMNRVLEPTNGTVKIGGVSLREADPVKIKAMVAYVPQKSVLFSGSVLDNLKYGDLNASDEACITALEQAAAVKFVTELPEGINTKLGKNGVNISGGQKQRLSIARALLHKPQILILDDATSALDSLTEREVKNRMRAVSGMTLVVVAQKIASVMDLDRIIVLNEGAVEAFDTHDNLLKCSETYQAIYAAERR